MAEKSFCSSVFDHVSLKLVIMIDLSNYAVLLFVYHHVGDNFSVPLIYYISTLHFSY